MSIVARPSEWHRLAGQGIRRAVACAAIAVGVADLVWAAKRSGAPARLHALGRATATMTGTRYLLLLAGMALLLNVFGLLHAKRNAWRVAVVLSIASCFAFVHRDRDVLSPGLLLAGGLVALLVLTSGSFRARSDPLMARRGLRLLIAGEVVVFAYGTAGLYFLDEAFRDSATLIDAARSAVRLLLLLPANAITPIDPDGRWFVDSVRLAGLGVVVVALILVVASVLATAADASDRRLVERLIGSWATNNLASFHLLAGTSWFISEDRGAFIGYRLVGMTAVALAEPIGEPESRTRVVAEFLDLCELNGWVPTFHQLSPAGAESLAAAGLKHLKIGEEAIVPVQTWDEDAHAYKQLRSALRRVERCGCELVELPRPIDDATMRELREVSDAWLSQGAHRERTFTVGQFDPDYLRRTSVLVLRRRDSHRIEAFVNVLPAYSSSVGNFDLMRRRPDAPNGAMEYLVVGLIHRFRAEGRAGMTLGLAPLANIDGDGIADRALRLLYDRGTRVFNYQGLHRFKEKWSPVWEPRYLAYRSETELPRIAAALARVGEIPDPRGVRGRALAMARRFPVTLSIGLLVVWIMAATRLDPAFHHVLERHFGLSFVALQHLQFWRLPTAELIQTSAGFRWANIALLSVSLPFAEWRLGSRRSILVFFVCDWISSLATYGCMTVFAAMGSSVAHQILIERDSGSSAGAWALATAGALSLTDPRRRRSAVASIFVFLGGALLIFHRLFDLQHLLAALVAVAVTMAFDRATRRPSTVEEPPQVIAAR
jgi:phosphatidylglycerol lysyltransferase